MSNEGISTNPSIVCHLTFNTLTFQNADVAELVYAQVSEACGCKALRVRVSPSAPPFALRQSFGWQASLLFILRRVFLHSSPRATGDS